MSFYALVFGDGKDGVGLLGALGFTTVGDVGRYRSAWLEKVDGQYRIAVYTRNGGGNRDHWYDDSDRPEGAECDCPGCVIGYRLPMHPQYLFDRDDDFDCTYATVYFSLTEGQAAEVAELEASGKIVVLDAVDTSQRWHDVIAAIERSVGR